ncbi:hypothetical protein [Streptomyces sp. NPDC020965]|uniref:hypothetical protein n=1 Tax=Streptomyces sp. NPDC020965 TaxID=3365105 RepID=UPI0037AE9D45
MRDQRRGRRLAAGLAAALALGAAAVSPASADSVQFDYPVKPPAAPDYYADIPGTEVTFTAAAGEASYLWSRNMTAVAVSALAQGDNIGNTFAVRCRYANGATLPAGTETGAYWAANLVPPGEAALRPTLRWLFIAPDAGSFTCRLSVTAYSSIIHSGRQVTMRIPAGAQLARAVYPSAARWTLPASGNAVVARGTTASTLGYTYTASATDRVAIVLDANVSTCTAGSPICGGGTPAYQGSSAETWIEAQPQRPDGTTCGAPLKSAVGKWTISDAKHHQAVTNTLYATRAQLGDCTELRASLKVRNTAGNPLNIHAGHASERISASRGVAFNY